MMRLLISLRSSVVFFLALLVLLVIFSIIIVYSLSVTLYDTLENYGRELYASMS